MGFSKRLALLAETLLILIIFVLFSSAANLTDSLNLYYKMENPSEDGLSVFGNPFVIEGKINNSLALDGIDDFARRFSIPEISTAKNYSISLWLNYTGNWSSDHGVFFNTINLSDRMVLGGVWNGKIGTRSYGGAENDSEVTNSSIITPNTFHHFVIIHYSNNTILLYIDNSKQNSSAAGVSTSATEGLLVGRGSGEYWKGSVDEILVFNKTLSESEIDDLYNLRYAFQETNFSAQGFGSAVRYEYYNIGDDTTDTYYLPEFINCQSFTPQRTFNLTGISRNIFRSNSPGIVNVTFYSNNGSGLPGNVLTYNTFNATSELGTLPAWHNLSIPNYIFESDTMYIYCYKGGDVLNPLKTRDDLSTEGYNRGTEVYTVNGGSSYYNETRDNLFELWGFPFGDAIPPIITVLGPSNNSKYSGKTVEFSYYVNDNSYINHCNLYVLGNLKETNSNITKNTLQFFRTENDIRNHEVAWFVSCTDSSGNTKNSSQYFLDTRRNERENSENPDSENEQEMPILPKKKKITYEEVLSKEQNTENQSSTEIIKIGLYTIMIELIILSVLIVKIFLSKHEV